MALLRPVSAQGGTKSNYIVVNEDWEVDIMTENLFQILNIAPSKYTNPKSQLLLNLLFCCPRLMRFTKFAKFLDLYEAEYFGIVQNRRTNQLYMGDMLKQNSFRPEDARGISKQPSRQDSQQDIRVPQQQGLEVVNETNEQKKYFFQKSVSNSSGKSQKKLEPEGDQIDEQQKNSGEQRVTSNNSNELQPETSLQYIEQLNSSHQILDEGESQPQLNKQPSLPASGGENPAPLSQQQQQQQAQKKKKGFSFHQLLKQRKSISKMKSFEEQKDVNSAGSPFVSQQAAPQQSNVTLEAPSLKLDPRNFNTSDMDCLTGELRSPSQPGNILGQQTDLAIKQITNQMTQLQKQSETNNHLQSQLSEGTNKSSRTDQDEEDEEEEDEEDEDNAGDDDDNENDLKVGGGEGDGTAKKKKFEKNQMDPRLESGETIKLTLKIPQNIDAILQTYYIISRLNNARQQAQPGGNVPMFGQDPSLYPGNAKDTTAQPGSSARGMSSSNLNYYGSSVVVPNATVLAERQKTNRREHDRIIFEYVKQVYQQFYKSRKNPIRLFKMICSAKFRKNERRIGILKVQSIEEISQRRTRVIKAGNKDQNQQSAWTKGLQGFIMGITENLQKNNSDDLDSIFNNSKEKGIGYQQLDSNKPSNNENQILNFHKDFNNRQGVKNFSLSTADNIYIKEDNYRPNKQIKSITQIKWFLRVFFITLLVLNITTFLLGPSLRYTSLKKSSYRIYQQQDMGLKILESYNTILDILFINQNVYDQSLFQSTQFLTPDKYMEQSVRPRLSLYASTFQEINQNKDFQLTIFDPKMSQQSQIDKQIIQGQQQQATAYDNSYTLDYYDLIQHFMYFMNEINTRTPEELRQLKENDTGVVYIRENVVRYLDQFFEMTEYKLLASLNNDIENIEELLMYIIIVQAFLITVSFVLLMRQILMVCQAFRSVLEAFHFMHFDYIKDFRSYSEQLLKNFCYLVDKDNWLNGVLQDNAVEGGDQIQGSFLEKQDLRQGLRQELMKVDKSLYANQNAGKKQQKLIYTKFLQKTRLTSFVIYILFSILVAILSFSLYISVVNSTNDVQKMTRAVLQFDNQITLNVAIMLSIKERTFNHTSYFSKYQEIFTHKITQFLNQNRDVNFQKLNMARFDEIADIIYKNSPCSSKLGLILPEEQLECETVGLQGLLHGLTTFNYNYLNTFRYYIQFANSSSYGAITVPQIYDYDRGVHFSDKFLIHLMKTWSSDMMDYFQQQLTFLTVFIICMSIFLIIMYIIMSEYMLIGKLAREYKFFKKVYKMFIPEKTITQIKNIKLALIKHGVINR